MMAHRLIADLGGLVGPVGKSPVRLTGDRWHTLPAIWRACGVRTAAEVGVEQGVYSEALCRAVPGLQLTCVDAWRAYQGYREHVSQKKLDGFYASTVERLERFGCRILRAWSVEAAAQVPDGSLDAVYLDANHVLPFVVADLAAWVPKVKRGGLVCGHDYRRDDKHVRLYHVREAVHAWTSAFKIAPWYLLTGDPSATWLWVRDA